MKKYLKSVQWPALLVLPVAILAILFHMFVYPGREVISDAEARQQINEETTDLLKVVDDCLKTEVDRETESWSEDSLSFCQDLLLAENASPPIGVVCKEIESQYSYECDYVNRGWTYSRIMNAYGHNLPAEKFVFSLTNVPLTNGTTILYLSVQTANITYDNTTYYLDRNGIAKICTKGMECVFRGDPQLNVMLSHYNHQVPLFHEIAPTGWVHLLTYRLNNHCDNYTDSGSRFLKYQNGFCYWSNN